MEERHMIVDLAHASAKTIEVFDNNQNLTDDQIRGVAAKGGLIGIGVLGHGDLRNRCHGDRQKRCASFPTGPAWTMWRSVRTLTEPSRLPLTLPDYSKLLMQC